MFTMNRTVSIRFPTGGEIPFTFPSSPLMDAVVDRIFQQNEYPQIPFLAPGIIVDIGANVGATALLFTGYYPSASIYCLEPSREAFEYLKQNTAPLGNVRVFNVGAHDRDAEVQLHVGRDASV